MSEELKNHHNYANFEQGSWNVHLKNISTIIVCFWLKTCFAQFLLEKKNQVFSAKVSLNISWQVHENFVNKILLNTVNTVLLMNSLHESNCSIVTERLFLYISFNLPLNVEKEVSKDQFPKAATSTWLDESCFRASIDDATTF